MKNPIRSLKKSEQPPAPIIAAPMPLPTPPPAPAPETVNLQKRRDQLATKVAELQWDLGGLVYEMAIRDRIKPEVIVERAAALQDADAELGEVERILRLELTGIAALCNACGAPHSTGATFCWQCGATLLQTVPSTQIAKTP